MIYISKRHIYLRVDESYYFLYVINQLRALPTGSALLRIYLHKLKFKDCSAKSAATQAALNNK